MGRKGKRSIKSTNRTKTSLRHAKVIYISVWGVNGGGMDAYWIVGSLHSALACSSRTIIKGWLTVT